MRLTVGAALVVLGLAQSAHAQPAQPAEQRTVPVGVVKVERKPIARMLDFVGRVEAIERVEIRARVKGFLDAVLFKEGDLIQEGAPLYRIEKGMFEAQVEQAEGALARSKASLALATVQRQRAEELLQRNAGTVVARDQAVAAEAQAKGAITTNQADLDEAKINLGYTDILSPITGRISRTTVTKGNVVGPDSGPLTMIVSQDPMYVTFPVSQREFLKVQQSGGEVDAAKIKVRLRFADRTMYASTGVIDFVDVTVDRATDTVTVRATFPNPKSALIDGQLVRVMLESGNPQDQVVVPQSAIIADQEGTYVFIVEDGKAAIRRLKLGGESGPNLVVQEGLSGGEQVIVEGLQSIRPGTPVRAMPVQQTLGQG